MKVLQDPLYGPIYMDDLFARVVDTAAFQRLRSLRQLQHAYLVYPSAMHSRFEHALGAYHVSGLIIDSLRARGVLGGVTDQQVREARFAALVHDLGHAAATHLLEEAGAGWADHERIGEQWILGDEISAVAGEHVDLSLVARIVRHEAPEHPLAWVVAGVIDADRLDYFRRDPYYCGLPLSLNIDRLIGNLIPFRGIAEDHRVAVRHKALGTLDQMVFHRFKLYTDLYWHRTVRCASVMARALILRGLASGLASPDEVVLWHDVQMLDTLRERAVGAIGCMDDEVLGDVIDLARRIEQRQLYSVALDAPASVIDPIHADDLPRIEDSLCDRIGMARGSLLVDRPYKPDQFSLPVPVLMPDGTLADFRSLGADDGVVLSGMSGMMDQAACRLRIYARHPLSLSQDVTLKHLQSVLP